MDDIFRWGVALVFGLMLLGAFAEQIKIHGLLKILGNVACFVSVIAILFVLFFSRGTYIYAM